METTFPLPDKYLENTLIAPKMLEESSFFTFPFTDTLIVKTIPYTAAEKKSNAVR